MYKSGSIITLMISLLIVFSCIESHSTSETPYPAERHENSELYQKIRLLDSIFFEIGFNTCNMEVFDSMVTEDIEFYHDQSGSNKGKDIFLQNTENGLCKLDYRPIRKLVDSTLSVFPLKNNGEIYGAIENGHHLFFARYPDKEELVQTSEAEFSHLWIFENGRWKISRVLSYDHRSP